MGSANSNSRGMRLPVEDGGPQRLRVADGLAVDGITGRQPHPLIVPGGLGVPLAIEEIQPGDADPPGKSHAQLGIPLELLAQLALQIVGHIDFTLLQHGQARRRVRDGFEDQPLDVGHFTPVPLDGLHDQLDARRIADKLVGPQADGMLAKALIPHFFNIFLWDNPARTRVMVP